jgi:hypothetical protein
MKKHKNTIKKLIAIILLCMTSAISAQESSILEAVELAKKTKKVQQDNCRDLQEKNCVITTQYKIYADTLAYTINIHKYIDEKDIYTLHARNLRWKGVVHNHVTHKSEDLNQEHIALVHDVLGGPL